MNISEFNKKTHESRKAYYNKPRIFCNDGFNFSVQGSRTHYCSPREDCNDYYSMEIGYPSAIEKSILEFAEDKDTPMDSVYGYVPVDLIDDIIIKHGGINETFTFQGND